MAASITVDAAGKIAAAAAAASEQQQQQSVEMNICVKQQSAISSLSQHHPSHQQQQQQPPPPNILPMVSSPRHIGGQVAPNSDVGGLAAGSPRKRNAAVVVVHPSQRQQVGWFNYYRTVANVKQIIFFEGLPSPARQLPHLPRKLSAATRGCTATTSTAPRQSIGAGLFQAPPVQGYKVSSALHKHPSAKSGQLARFRLLKSGV